MDTLITVLIALFSAGGMAAAVTAVMTSRSTSRKLQAEASRIGATTDVEVESVSVATMRAALESAQQHIGSLEAARARDREYYEERIDELQKQVATLRSEVRQAEEKLARVLRATEQTAEQIQRLRDRPTD